LRKEARPGWNIGIECDQVWDELLKNAANWELSKNKPKLSKKELKRLKNELELSVRPHYRNYSRSSGHIAVQVWYYPDIDTTIVIDALRSAVFRYRSNKWMDR
jgi:hypothetical protein